MQRRYAGMTTDERLVAAALLDRFGDAVRRRDPEEMVRLLLAVEIDPADAVNSVTLILADPRRYGY